MDSVPLDDKILIKKVEQVAKCPICFNLLRPPLWYCVNGHCICMACMGSLITCPTCRGSRLQTEKNVILEEILNFFPSPCKFNGCDVFEPETTLKLHESGCAFRNVSCRLTSCSWKGKANCLLDHLKNVHHNKACNTFKEESKVNLPSFKPDVERFNVAYANAYNCVFFLYDKTDTKKGKYMMCFVCVPLASGIVNNFYSTVIFSSKKQPDMKFQFTQKVYNEDVDINSAFPSETFLAIPLSETKHFIEEDDKLWFSYKIFRES